MLRRLFHRLHCLTFLCKVDMLLSDRGKELENDWTRSVHRRFWTAPHWMIQLALNRATKNLDHWGAARALVRIRTQEEWK